MKRNYRENGLGSGQTLKGLRVEEQARRRQLKDGHRYLNGGVAPEQKMNTVGSTTIWEPTPLSTRR